MTMHPVSYTYYIFNKFDYHQMMNHHSPEVEYEAPFVYVRVQRLSAVRVLDDDDTVHVHNAECVVRYALHNDMVRDDEICPT